MENTRHSLAHLLASAVLDLYPDALPTLGPATADGFYYDFLFSKPIKDSDLPKIEKRMKEILKSWDGFVGKEITAGAVNQQISWAKNPAKQIIAQGYFKSYIDNISVAMQTGFMKTSDLPNTVLLGEYKKKNIVVEK